MSEKVLDELAEWIDPTVIAQAILDEFEGLDSFEPTCENCQAVWLDFLEHYLSDGIHSSLGAVMAKS